MKKLVWSIPISALLVLVAFYLSNNRTELEQQHVAENESVWTNPEVVNSLIGGVETGFKFDSDRLYDISYEVAPDLVAFAASIGKTPACLIEIVKREIDGITPPESQCRGNAPSLTDEKVILPGTYETDCRIMRGQETCRRVKVADHPYEKYSDDELRALAYTSAEAAIILARRIPDDALSEQHYEQAVVLSGRPGPLEEWMLQRNLGGLVQIGGVLDMNKAKLGYEIYLTTAQLGYGNDAAAEYERILKDANVDLGPIQRRADARFARLTNARRAIVSGGWEG
jgi:hypothetical protein